MSSFPPSRAAAKAAGSTQYNTGKPCAKGHSENRFTGSGNCVLCDRATVARHRRRKHEGVAGRERPPSCEVCGAPTSRAHFDHDHKTGGFRGWLCRHCNLALGHTFDKPALLRKLADYLEAHQNGQTDNQREELAASLGLRRAGRKLPGS